MSLASLRAKLGPGMHRILANAGWMIAERVLRILAAAFVGVWVARHLGPAGYGDLSYALAIVSILLPLSGLGLHGILLRDLARDPDSENVTLGTAFRLRIIGGILTIPAATSVVLIVHPGQTVLLALTAVFSLAAIFQATETIEISFQSRLLSRHTVKARTAALILGSTSRIALILTGASVLPFACATAGEALAASVLLMLTYRLTGRRIAQWKADWAKAKSLLRQSSPLILSGVGAALNLDIDKFMLGRMTDSSSVGIYSAAAKLSEIWLFVPIAIATSAFPALVKSKSRGVEFYEARQQQLYDGMVWLALIVAVLMTCFSGPIVALLFGAEFQGASPILAIHVWASLFTFLGAALSKWLINEGLFTFSIRRHGLGAAINVLLNLVLIPRYGGAGAAVATLVSYATASWLACFTDRRTWPAAKKMTLALLAPIRLVIGKIRRS